MTADDDDIKNYAVNHCYCYSLIDWVLILFTTTRLELNSKSKTTTRRGLVLIKCLRGHKSQGLLFEGVLWKYLSLSLSLPWGGCCGNFRVLTIHNLALISKWKELLPTLVNLQLVTNNFVHSGSDFFLQPVCFWANRMIWLNRQVR